MVLNSKDRGSIRRVLLTQLEGQQFIYGTTTAGGAGSITDTAKLQNSIYVDSTFNNWELIVAAATPFSTRVTGFTKSTGVATFNSGAGTASSAQTYELLNPAGYTKQQADDAINLAIMDAVHGGALTQQWSEALAFERGRSFYPIPTAFSHVHKLFIDTRPRGYYNTNHVPSAGDTNTKLRDDAARTLLAQSFKIKGSNPGFSLGDVYLWLSSVGTLSGNVSVTIESDSSGSPDGTALATSANVDASTLSTIPTAQRFTFTTRPILQENTTYWIVLAGSFTISATTYINWYLDSDAGYGDGASKVKSATAWSAQTGDFIFSIRDARQFELFRVEGHRYWDVAHDSTRSIMLTKAGLELLNHYDGSTIVLEGWGAPSLPTADSTTVNVPYDYIVARAGMALAAMNMERSENRRDLINFWERRSAELYPKLRTLPQGIEVEGL